MCHICRELKPRFHKPPGAHIIKSTKPFKRISIDFMGSKHSSSQNKYILTVIDEYSRFPFLFPCPDLTASTVMKCLSMLFTMFGLPESVHSDRGTNFMSAEVTNYLAKMGINQTRTSPYHPQGNGQCERYNGVLWKSILLALKTKNKPVTEWETVINDVLHTARTLLCTATNATPHERFLNFARRSAVGQQLPTWLLTPGPVYIRKFVRVNKDDPLVTKAELLQANQNYATVRLESGREDTISLTDLSPAPPCEVEQTLDQVDGPQVEGLRRSDRQRRAPQRLEL